MIIGVWLSFGVRAPLSLWGLVHRLPVLESMRVPERIRFVFFLAVALFVAFGVDALCGWIRRRVTGRWSKVAAAAIPAPRADYGVNARELRHGASSRHVRAAHITRPSHPRASAVRSRRLYRRGVLQRLHDGIGA
jgi:hypothetical protein